MAKEFEGDYQEIQLETFTDNEGNRYEKDEEGRWCKLVMSKFCKDETQPKR